MANTSRGRMEGPCVVVKVPYTGWTGPKSAIAQYVMDHSPHSLWVWGPTGMQKSRSFSEKLKDVKQMRWLSWSDAMNGIGGEYGRVKEGWGLTCKARCLLVIDDFGKTGLNDPIIDGMFQLLDERLALRSRNPNSYRTWITSMYSPIELGEEIKRVYKRGNSHDMATAITRRIQDMCAVFPKDTASQRAKRKR